MKCWRRLQLIGKPCVEFQCFSPRKAGRDPPFGLVEIRAHVQFA